MQAVQAIKRGIDKLEAGKEANNSRPSLKPRIEQQQVNDGSTPMFHAMCENFQKLRQTIISDVLDAEWKNLEIEVAIYLSFSVKKTILIKE